MRGLPYSGNMSLTLSYFMFLSSLSFFSLFLLLTFQLSYSLSSMHPLCHADERSALLQFKESFIINNSTCRFLDDYLPSVASWTLEGENSSCCSWDGVECDKKSGHVIGLDLSSSCLYGSINSSSSLFQLVHLQQLDLSYNHFNFSQIPSSIGNLAKLKSLRLSDSFFAGQIPSEISQLSKLSSLDLSCNSDPSSCSLFNLLGFNPSSKRLLELKRPHFESLVQSLTNLEELLLSLVNIPYPVFSLLANMSSLSALMLINCGLLGELSTNIFRLPNIELVYLLQNPGLIGNLPDFNRTSHLKYLNVMGTGMSGEIPASIGNLGSLEQLQLGLSNFSGLVPPSIDAEQLAYLQADISFDVGLTNKLPDYLIYPMMAREYYDYSIIVKNKGLRTEYAKIIAVFALFDFSGNRFEGEIPESIGTLKGLIALDLSNNLLSGHIPSAMGNLKQLESLDLSLNKLSGKIPQQLAQLTYLSFFNVSYNNFTGPVPRGNQFNTFLNNSFEGNLGLCGNQLSRKCEGPKAFLPPLSASTDNQESGSLIEFDWKIVVIGYGSGFIIGVVIGHIVITRKHDWFLKNFGIRQPKASKGKKK